MKRLYAVMPVPLLLSGCMMLGMGGMGSAGGSGIRGDSHGSSMSGLTLVKESVVNGIRITVEVPPYLLGDALAYTVTLRAVRDKAYISDASMVLIVTSDDIRSQRSRATHPNSQSEHRDSSTTSTGQSNAGAMKVAPDKTRDGTYVFRPSLTTGGAYKFVFVVERVGNVTHAPPIEVEQRIQLDSAMDQHAGHGDRMTGAGMASVTVIGAGVMAIAMLVMLR